MLSAGWHDIRFENDWPDLRSLSCDMFMTDERYVTNWWEGLSEISLFVKDPPTPAGLPCNPSPFNYRAVSGWLVSFLIFSSEGLNLFNRLSFINFIAFLSLVEICIVIIFDNLPSKKWWKWLSVTNSCTLSRSVFDLIISNILKSYQMFLVIPLMTHWVK